jgi:hypothetical protein
MGSDMVAENTSATRGTPNPPAPKLLSCGKLVLIGFLDTRGVPQDTDIRDTKG